MSESGRKPDWLKVKMAPGGDYSRVRTLVHDLGLNTVCREARCPNAGECFANGTAAFMILGSVCTRDCGFCAVRAGLPENPDPTEPGRVARAVKALGLKYAVVTSVTRDDLTDGGAGHFAETVRAIRHQAAAVKIEVLIPDFSGCPVSLKAVLDSGPDVLNHNIETVPSLYPVARPSADYERSLELIKRAHLAGAVTKSGLMLGLGETESEVLEVLSDLRRRGCDIVTLGQYLRPSVEHLPVKQYLSPEAFDRLAREGRKMDFRVVFAGPLIRSSYSAGEIFSGLNQ